MQNKSKFAEEKTTSIKELESLCDKILSFHEEKFKSSMSGKVKTFTNLDHVVLFILPKSSKTLKSIRILTDNMHGEDALSLSRSIFENYINLSYILKENSENRADLFVNFGLKQQYEKAKKHFGDRLPDEYSKSFDSQFIEEYNKAYEKEDEELKTKGYKIKKNYWSRINIGEMADEVGVKSTYDTMYQFACQQTHTDSLGLLKYGESATDGEITISDSPSIEDVEESLIWSMNYFLMLYRRIIKYFKFDFEQDLDGFENELNVIVKRIQ